MPNMLIAVLFSFILVPTYSARILGVIPTPSYSHQVAYHQIWKELSLRGHQVTVLTTDPIKNASLTNLTEIDLNHLYEYTNKINAVDVAHFGVLKFFDMFVEIGVGFVDRELKYPEVQKLINNKDQQFDLVMVEIIFPGMYAFAERFKCPLIGLASLDAPIHSYELIGNPTHPVLYPDFLLPFNGDLTFFQRIINVGVLLIVKYYVQPKVYREQQLLVDKYFGNNYPPLEDIGRNFSLLFVNTDPIFHPVRPLVPAIIPIGGGTHLSPAKPLPKDLKNQLDKASQGVIYFSMGSNVKSKEMSEEVRRVILETFAELPYLVLWKFELEDLPGKPENVIISKWFPQQDVLKHPNIKLFVTQGGLQSMDEAIYSHVPMVGMPFWGDQPMNVAKLVAKGFGLSVDYKTLDKETLKSTILEVIRNPKYKNRIKKLAELARDQPMTGLERAIWWTEYVLRHKGASHLRSPAIDLPPYQYYLLDVIGFCLLVLIVITVLTVKIVKLIFKLVAKLLPRSKVKVQ